MVAPDRAVNAARYIAERLPLRPVPGRPDILLHTAGPKSGLWRLATETEPYWAWPWAGGLALALHLAADPALVKSRSVLDLGTGSGLVAIAAARAGAASVRALDSDPNAIAAATLNATANGAIVATRCTDPLDGPPFEAQTILVGDLFYAPALAARVCAYLDRCLAQGAEIYVGDVGRSDLPLARLTSIAEYVVADFADGLASAPHEGKVYRYVGDPESGAAAQLESDI